MNILFEQTPALAIILAVVCLLAAGSLDLVFKLYVSTANSRGLMVAGVAGVWLALQSLSMFTYGSAIATDPATLLWGSLAAVAVTVSNLALLECLGRLPISTASTIYRLNTIPLVLLAIFFLGEAPVPIRLAGVCVGLFAVVLLFSRSRPSQVNGGSALVDDKPLKQSINPGWIWFALIIAASCVRAGYGILTKFGLSAGGNADTMILMGAVGWLIGGLLYFRIIEARHGVTCGPIRLIVLAGILVFSVVWLLTTALSIGDASVVVPIANMGFVAAFVLSLLLKLEFLTLRKLLAILFAIVSILLLAAGA